MAADEVEDAAVGRIDVGDRLAGHEGDVIDPEIVAYDLHPEYLATKYAFELPQPDKIAVQHHHAHVAARLVEHGREDAVIGVSMDGLGYGDDGRLLGRGGARVRPDRVPAGRTSRGAAAPRRGRRDHPAVAHGPRMELRTPRAGGAGARRRSGAACGSRRRGRCAATKRPRVRRRTRRSRRSSARWTLGVNAPPTTSCGRLFDAVAALAGVRRAITYEGQAAIELEMMASGPEVRRTAAEPYGWTTDGDAGAAACGPLLGATEWVAARAAGDRTGGRFGDGDIAVAAPAVVRLAPLLDGVLADVEAGAAPGFIGARLHRTWPRSCSTCAAGARRRRAGHGRPLRRRVPEPPARGADASGCSRPRGFEVLAAGLVPVNDGGVSLGQAAVAGYTVLERRGELR